MSEGGKGCHNYVTLRSDDAVAASTGFGSRERYRKAKFIDQHADEETIKKLDAEEISIHRAWKETKARLEAAALRDRPKGRKLRDSAIS